VEKHVVRHGDHRYVERHVVRHGDHRRFERHVYHHGPRVVHRDVRIGGPRWHQGQYLPRHVVQQRHVVIDHRHHRHLYAPPRGHQWVQVGPDYVLVVIGTGLIVQIVLGF